MSKHRKVLERSWIDTYSDLLQEKYRLVEAVRRFLFDPTSDRLRSNLELVVEQVDHTVED